MRPAFFIGAPALLAVAALAFTFGGRLPAHHQDHDHDGPPPKAVYDALRTVINQGAEMYNNRRDYHGCYRLYQGSLLALKPLLKGHADLQKSIDEGLARAEGIPVSWQKAFALRDVIDGIRNKLGKAAGVPTDKGLPDKKLDDKKDVDKKPIDDKKDLDKKDLDKKDVDKKTDGKKDLDKKDGGKKDADKKPLDGKKDADKTPPVKKSEINKGAATVTGKVAFKGQALNSGFVTFVGHDRRYSANITEDGKFRFREGLPAGEYTVIIEPSVFQDPKAPPAVGIPARYRSADTTPLRYSMKEGGNTVDLNLN